MIDGEVSYRQATADDAAEIAALHADSWRRHYRGAYPESFFDESLDADRLAVWSTRLADGAGTCTVVGERSGLVGFVHVRFDEDERRGALIDNLHVRHDVQRTGIASTLMERAAAEVVAAAPGSGMFLWVLEQNTRAQAFYLALGGAPGDFRTMDPPALPSTRAQRMSWPDPAAVRRDASRRREARSEGAGPL